MRDLVPPNLPWGGGARRDVLQPPQDLPTAGGSWPRTSFSASGTGSRPPRCRPGSASTGRARPSTLAFPSWMGLPFLQGSRGEPRDTRHGDQPTWERSVNCGFRAAVSPCGSTDRKGKLTAKVLAAD